MAYNTDLADRIREYLITLPELHIEEKEMFSGLVFMINGKMCINVSRNNLMCRYDPNLYEIVAERKGYQPMIMKGREIKGYCYVEPIGYTSNKDLNYWITLCLNYNEKAKAAKKPSNNGKRKER